jgi:hypothetical protein
MGRKIWDGWIRQNNNRGDIKMIELKQVESSNIDKVGYDEKTLFILFKNGGLYKYIDVPSDIYDGLVVAESVGKYLNTEVKKKKFVCERIWDDDLIYKELVPPNIDEIKE